MKAAIALLFLTLPAFAADKTEVINTKLRVRIAGVGCIVQAGGGGRLEDRLSTRLNTPNHTVLYGPELELRHETAAAQGCDLAKLDRIVADAENNFGFLMAAPAKITKVTYASFRAQDGSCVARYNEVAVVEIGEGLSLSSYAAEIRPATDCN